MTHADENTPDCYIRR